MRLAAQLRIFTGVTAVIGSGGKTMLLRTLGEELAASGRVLLCTTTKIFPFPGLPCARTAAELDQQLRSHRLMCAGSPVADAGKLTAPSVPLEMLTAWFDYILVEADGAAGRPLKAHAPHEPVIPPEAGRIICVVGAAGFGLPIAEAAHRPELYARLAGVQPWTPATPETVAAVLKAERLYQTLYINQVETAETRAAALALAAQLEGPVLAGSLQKEAYFTCSC